MPVQFSPTSQSPADARQIVLDGRKPSAGHSRQALALDWKPSAGQAARCRCIADGPVIAVT